LSSEQQPRPGTAVVALNATLNTCGELAKEAHVAPAPSTRSYFQPLTLRSWFVLMSKWPNEMTFLSKVIRLEKAGEEVLARASNIVAAKAAFDVSVSLYQTEEIELCRGSRVICSSKRDAN
jgi:hypothetical protein